MWHEKIDRWMLDQASVELVPIAVAGGLRQVS